METELHLTGLFIVHGGTKLVIGNKVVICSAEAVKHSAVSDAEIFSVNDKTDDSAGSKTIDEVNRAEAKYYKNYQKHKNRADDNGSGRIFVRSLGNEILSCSTHFFGERIGDDKVKEKLP